MIYKLSMLALLIGCGVNEPTQEDIATDSELVPPAEPHPQVAIKTRNPGPGTEGVKGIALTGSSRPMTLFLDYRAKGSGKGRNKYFTYCAEIPAADLELGTLSCKDGSIYSIYPKNVRIMCAASDLEIPRAEPLIPGSCEEPKLFLHLLSPRLTYKIYRSI